MPILTELIVSVVGGVLTAMILAIFSGRSRRAGNVAVNRQSAAAEPRRSSLFGDTIRLVLAVIGGIAVSIVLGGILIQAGIAPRGAGVRLVLMVVATVLFWLILSAGRRR